MNETQQFADAFAREHATTRRVLHALPASKSEFMPDAGAPAARVLASVFSQGQWGIAQAMSGEWQWPPRAKPAAASSPTVWVRERLRPM